VYAYTDAEGPKKTKFSLERLAACIAIAVENADILFTDPCDGFSMWKLRPDGCAVRPLNCTILEFIAAATVEDLQVDWNCNDKTAQRDEQNVEPELPKTVSHMESW
jgi:hypothetical protein